MGMPVKPALTLAIIAAVLTAVLALVASFTRERIASNEQAWIRQRLDALANEYACLLALDQLISRRTPVREPIHMMTVFLEARQVVLDVFFRPPPPTPQPHQAGVDQRPAGGVGPAQRILAIDNAASRKVRTFDVLQ